MLNQWPREVTGIPNATQPATAEVVLTQVHTEPSSREAGIPPGQVFLAAGGGEGSAGRGDTTP